MSTLNIPFSVRRVPGLLGLAICCLLSLLASPVWAQADAAQPTRSLEEATKSLAEQIKKIMSGQGASAVTIDQFKGPAGASGGTKIVQSLQDQLKAASVTVASAGQQGAWNVEGKFRGGKNPESGQFTISIDSNIQNQLGEEIGKLKTQVITNEQSGLELMGISTPLPAQVTPQQAAAGTTLEEARADKIIQSVTKPGIFLENTLVKVEQASPFAIEILLATNDQFQPIPPRESGGVAFCDIPPTAIYAIRLINNTDQFAGVALTVDGINSLHFSKTPGFAQAAHWVVPPKGPQGPGSSTIRGWHDVGDNYFSFQVTKIGESAAAKLGNLGGVGTITATFCAAFTEAPPPDEAKLASTRGDFATGFGPAVQAKTTGVQMKFGAPRAAVSIRYLKPDEADLPPVN